MAYTKHTLIQILIALAAIFSLAWAYYFISDTYDAEVVQGFDAPASSFTVSREAPLRIPLPRDEKAIAGVVLYAADAVTAQSSIKAYIQDEHGNILATKLRQHVQYKQNGHVAIFLYVQRKVFPAEDEVFFTAQPHSDSLLSFTATPDGKVVYSLVYKKPVSAATKQGILIGTALALCFLLLQYVRTSQRSQWIAAGGIICVYSMLATLPYLYPVSDWGIFDWDYRHSLSHIYQTTIKEHHQFPFWNPYICGGAAALGDPEFAVFTPSFFLQFVFGVENGTGMALALSFCIAGIGMLFLANRLGLDPFPALLSATVLLFSSSLMLKATEGHTTILFAFMWVPWILWAWYRARPFVCGVFLTLALLQGGIYILSYTAVAFVILALLARNRMYAMRISLYSFMWLVGLASFQLVPSLLWVQEFPDQAFVGSGYTYKNMWDIFFGRYLQYVFVIPNQLSRWHEYGAYIGYGVFALVLVGISYIRSSRIVQALLVGALTTIFVSSLGPAFEPILQYFSFLPRSNISRLVLFTVLCAALLSGFGMKRIISLLPPFLRFIPVIITGYIAIDLFSLAYPIAEEGFAIPRPRENLAQSPSPLTHTSETFTIRHNGNDMPRSYAAVLKGYGTSSFCAVIGPKSAVAESEPYIQSAEGVKTDLLDWSPNRITFSYESPDAADISINTNYASGWRTNYGKIVSTNPRLTVRVPSGESTVTLSYVPPGLVVGFLITLLTLLYAAIHFKHLFR